jgi:hypothetical protein
MKQGTDAGEAGEGFNAWAARRKQKAWCVSGVNKREYQRFSYAVRASVVSRFLPTREYGVCDFSRCGMYLAYTDERATWRSLMQNEIEPGTELVVRLTVALKQGSYCCRLPVRLVRLDRHGIGVRFVSRAPWQITALVDLLSRTRATVQSDAGATAET